MIVCGFAGVKTPSLGGLEGSVGLNLYNPPASSGMKRGSVPVSPGKRRPCSAGLGEGGFGVIIPCGGGLRPWTCSSRSVIYKANRNFSEPEGNGLNFC